MEFSSKSLKIGKRLRNMSRLAQIVNILSKHGFWTFLEAAGIKTWLPAEQLKTAEELSRIELERSSGGLQNRKPFTFDGSGIPARVRAAFEELGPAFVKLGQVLASRQDLLNEQYIEEFRKLHQDVQSLPFSSIREVIQSELKTKLLDDFESISERCLAAGSIGQVHQAVLKDGSRVVIKVQRPGIVEQIKTDLALMEYLAGIFERYVPESRVFRPKVIVEEFTNGILGELDFVREAGNTTKISENLEDLSFVEIPEVYWNYTTAKVLTLSFVEGFRISNKSDLEGFGLNTSVLVERGLSVFLQMVFKDGLYHGDLHAGNLLALPDNRIGILDFGLSISLGRNTREHLAGLLVSLVDEDYEALVGHFVELADPDTDFDNHAFEDEISNTIAPFVGLKLAKIPTGRLLWDLAGIAARHGAPMPRTLIAFFKTIASFEGIGLQLDPNFDMISTCKNFTDDLVRHMYSPQNVKKQLLVISRDLATLGRHAPRQMRSLLRLMNEGNLKLNISSPDSAYIAASLDRLASRLAVSIIVAALVVGSSILILSKVGEEYHRFPMIGLVGFLIAGVLGLYVIASIFRGGGRHF